MSASNPITGSGLYQVYQQSRSNRVPLQDRRPVTAEELNSSAWGKPEPLPSHQGQIQGLKEMFFTDSKLYASPKTSKAVEAMDQEMDRLADQFFDGSLSAEGLANAFERLAGDFLTACRESQYPVPAAAGGMEEVALSTVYDHFRERILSAAVRRNQAEGQQYASREGAQFRYYNARYYHQSEEAIGAITGRVTKMAEERGLDQFEIPDYEALGLFSHRNFNTAVSGHSNVIPGGLTLAEDPWILDYDMVPPEGFQFFYEPGIAPEPELTPVDDPDAPVTEGLAARVWASFLDASGALQTLSRDFHFSVTGLLDADQKNLGSLLQFQPASKKGFAAMNQFLKNFQVTPPHYASLRSMDRGLNLRA